MATITTASDGAYETGATWVGGSVPGDSDIADINHNLTFGVSDIVAQLDIASGKTVIMADGTSISGMTASPPSSEKRVTPMYFLFKNISKRAD